MESNLQELYEVRDFKPEDKSFIMATFLRGLYYGNTWFGAIPKDIFMNNYKHIIEALLHNPKTTLKIACLKEDKDVILGYSILSADYQTIHWVFVKSAWRKQGIAKTLVPQHPVYATHLSELGKVLLTKLQGAVFNPFAL